MMFTVNNDCLKCGLCAELCPARIIKYVKKQPPEVPDELENRCIQCGQCVAFCPTGACHLSFQPDEERVALNLSSLPEADSAETFIRSRRSIRHFKDEPLPDDLITRILETTRFAPSASNSQPVRWIVIRARQSLLELGMMTARHFQNSPSGDEQRRKHFSAVAAAQERGEDIIFRGAPQLALAVVPKVTPYPEDAAIALTYFELGAHALGVGCCWAGYFTSAAREDEAVQKALKLESSELVVGGQMFGRPKGPAPAKILPPRKKPDLTWL